MFKCPQKLFKASPIPRFIRDSVTRNKESVRSNNRCYCGKLIFTSRASVCFLQNQNLRIGGLKIEREANQGKTIVQSLHTEGKEVKGTAWS